MILYFLQAAMAGGLLLFPFIAFVLLIGILFFTFIIYGFLIPGQAAADINTATGKRKRIGKHLFIFLLSFAIAIFIVVILSLFGIMLLSGFIPGFD